MGVILTEIGQHWSLYQAQAAIRELQQIPILVKQQHAESTENLPEPFFLYNTRRLEIFATLYLTKGMKNTASLLHITQPAVSSAIAV